MAIYGSSEWGMYARIHGPYIGAYMGHMGAAMGHACAHNTWATWEQQMGHVCAHTWAIYGGIHGAYMRAYIAIYRSSPIGRVGRKGIIGSPFLSLVIPAPSLPLPSLLERKGAGVIPFPSLPYSAAYL